MKEKFLEWVTLKDEINTESQSKKKNVFKKKNFIIPILLGVFSTMIQLLFFKSCQNQSDNSTNSKYAIVVAIQNIPEGETLSEDNTKLVYLDLGESKEQFILNSEFRHYLGYKTKINIEKNSPILKELVLNKSRNLSLPEKIPRGKRFYTIDIDLSSISSVIKIGDTVDIIAHMDINGFGKATETILQRIKIVGIGTNFEEKSPNIDASSLSFYLTPEEVKIISFMKSYSQFTVALRNPNDLDQSDNSPITFNKFIQNDRIQEILQNDSFKIIEGNRIKK